MKRNLTPLDISNQPDLLRLAEEVQATRTPRVLKRASESIAVVMPLAPAQPQHEEDIWQHYDPTQVKQALQDSAGALAGVDTATLLSDITAERTQKPHDRSL